MKNNIKISVICMAGLLAMASCSDGFLEDKKNYDNVNSDIYNYYRYLNSHYHSFSYLQENRVGNGFM